MERILKNIISRIDRQISIPNHKEGFDAACDMCKKIIIAEVEQFRQTWGFKLPDVTVEEALQKGIIGEHPFTLKGSFSGKVYFYSWKSEPKRMPEYLRKMKLSQETNILTHGYIGKYSISPKVRVSESVTFGDSMYLKPYEQVWVCDYDYVHQKEQQPTKQE